MLDYDRLESNIKDVEKLIKIARGDSEYFVQDGDVFFVSMPYVKIERHNKKQKCYTYELVKSDSPKFEAIVSEFAGRIKDCGAAAYDVESKVDEAKGHIKSTEKKGRFFSKPKVLKSKDKLSLRTFKLGIDVFISIHEAGKKNPKVKSGAVSYTLGFTIVNALHARLDGHLRRRSPEDAHFIDLLNDYSITDFKGLETEQAVFEDGVEPSEIKFLKDWFEDNTGNSMDGLDDLIVSDLSPEMRARLVTL